MGFGELFTRDTKYTATDTKSGFSQTFTIVDNIAPDWGYGGEYRGGMSLPGAWRAATLVSDLLGGVPWYAYRERAGLPVEQITPTPPLLLQPAPPDTRMTTLSSMVLDLIWHGNAVAIIAERNKDGWPTALLPCPAEYVHARRVHQSDTQINLPVGEIVYFIGQDTYTADDVIHVKGPCRPGGLRGMGLIENHLGGTVALAAELSRQAKSLTTSGIPTGILRSTDPEMEQEDADALKLAWVASQRDRTVAVLNSTTDFQPLAWNPSESQLLDARKYSLHELALIFGIPPYFLGVDHSGSKTYSNVEQEGLNLLKYSSLAGHLARFEQTISQHLPRGTYARADLDSILRADTKTRYEAHAIGIASGFLTDDEAREIEGRPPLTPAQRARLKPPAPAPAAQGTAPAAPAASSPNGATNRV